MDFDPVRYSRQTVLPEVGAEGQRALAASRVLCVGAGGLGSPVLLYLAAAGVGTLGVIDGDQVELSNLPRQVLFGEADLQAPKAEAAARELRARNSAARVVAHAGALTAANARAVLAGYDLVVDATDAISAKFLINDACAARGIPWVYGSVNRWEGRVAPFHAARGPCYRCLYPAPPRAPIANCAESGVLGAVTGIVGSWQALHALQILLPQASHRYGMLTVMNLATAEQLKIQIAKDPACPTCSRDPAQIALTDAAAPACAAPRAESIRAAELRAAYADYGALDVRTPAEWERGHLAGARHWPLAELERGNLPDAWLAELRRQGKRPVVYCQSGGRSRRAGAILAIAGYPEVIELEAGIAGWGSLSE